MNGRKQEERKKRERQMSLPDRSMGKSFSEGHGNPSEDIDRFAGVDEEGFGTVGPMSEERGHVIIGIQQVEGVEEKLRFLVEWMWILDTTITMAPLLGLLGTIMGIISSFHVMSISGLGKPAQITGGVAEALIATATGLVIAIISLGFYNMLNTQIREIRNGIESSARLLFHLQEHLTRSDTSRSVSGSAPQAGFHAQGQPELNLR